MFTDMPISGRHQDRGWEPSDVEPRPTFMRIAFLLSTCLLSPLLLACSGDSSEKDQAEPEPSVSSSGFEPERRVPDLAGAWIVTQLASGDGRSLLPKAAPALPTLIFDGGQLRGDTGGCNSISGRYKQAGDLGQDLMFPKPSLGSTLVGCKEAPLVRRLAAVRHVSRVSNDTLSLLAEDGSVVAELHRRGQRQ